MGCDILLYSVVLPGILLKPAWDLCRAKLTSKLTSKQLSRHWLGTSLHVLESSGIYMCIQCTSAVATSLKKPPDYIAKCVGHVDH